MAQNKAYDIIQFEGGMNDHADARDIEDNQVALLNNLLVTNKGVIRVGYSNVAEQVSLYPVLDPTTSAGVNIKTRNLWVYKNDFNLSLSEAPSEWLLASDGNKLYRREMNDNGNLILGFDSNNIVVGVGLDNSVKITISSSILVDTAIINSSITVTDADGGDQATGAFETGTTISSDGSSIIITWNSSDALGANATGSVTLNKSIWQIITNFGLTSPSHSTYPNLVIYDGNIRYSDGKHILDGSSPYLPLTKTKFYGQARRKYFNATTNTVSTIEGDTSIIKPTDGIVIFNEDIETASNNPTRGFLGLEISKIEDTILERRSFGDASTPTFSETTATGAARIDYQKEWSLLGKIYADAPNIVMKDTYGSSYTEEQITASGELDNISAQFITTSILTGSANAYRIGYEFGGSPDNYLYVSVNPDTYDSVWGADDQFTGNANRSIKINGKFIKHVSNAWTQKDWDETDDDAATIHKVNADGSIGAEITPQTTLDDQEEYILFRFIDQDDTTQYRITVSTGSAEVFEIDNIELYATLGSVSPDTTDPKHLKFDMGVGDGVARDEYRVEFNNFFNTDYQSPNNLVNVKMAVKDDIKVLKSVDFIITNDHTYDTISTHKNLIYTLGSSWLAENKGKGWLDITFKLSEISNIENNPVIGNLPDFIIRINYSVNLVTSSGVTGTGSNEIAFDSISQTSDDRGTWDGNYKFYYSWVYDRIQETSYYEFSNQLNGLFLSSQRLNGKAVIKELSSGGFGTRGKRITGANIYFKEWDKDRQEEKYDDPFLLFSSDFEKGCLKPIGTSISSWSLGTVATDHYTHTALQFIDPPLSKTFSINSGYDYDPLNSIEEIRFRTATILNRRLYYGNVDILWEKFSGETNYKRNKYQDRVYKSLSNKPDIIPHYNYLDIDINDGDEITALASYADRLLVFKKNMMYLVNATKEMEFLEDKYIHKGVESDQSVVETDIGIAWANSNGAYHYDGEKVVDLTLAKIKQSTFNAHLEGTPSILYEPKERHLIILSKSSVNGWVCDLDTGAWSKTNAGISGSNADATNAVLHSGNIIMARIDDDASNQFTFFKIAISNASDEEIMFDLKTKDYALNEVGGKVDIKAIYITYKSTISGSSKVGVSFYKNKLSTAIGLTNGTLATTSGNYLTTKLTPTPKSDGRSIHTIQLRFKGLGTSGVAMKDFELHDVSIIYKEKSLK